MIGDTGEEEEGGVYDGAEQGREGIGARYGNGKSEGFAREWNREGTGDGKSGNTVRVYVRSPQQYIGGEYLQYQY